MKEWLPFVCKGSEKFLYNMPNANEDILKMFGLTFHATRYALTNEKSVLNVHIDSQNPTDICELEQSHMNTPVKGHNTSTCTQPYQVIRNTYWKVKKDTKETPGQRYTPAVNRKASQDKIVSSVKLIVSIHHAILSVEQENWEESYLSRKAIVMFSKSPKGIYHAVELLLQQIL
eukprot:6467156-Ditylum_brightwellii.AAC.2